MNPTRCITLASRNAGKASEFLALLGDGWKVLTLADFPGVPDVVEDGHTFLDNATKKAVETGARVEGLVLADDSGLEVDALEGAPGVFSARFAGEHGDAAANNRLLLEKLAGLPPERRGAQFRCVLALAREGQVLFHCEGVCRGWIGFEPRGRMGFGYDPLFIPEWQAARDGVSLHFGKTFAEIDPAEKNRHSHRGRAMATLASWLDREFPA